MARPIEPTPTIYGEDAERLLADLEKVCSPEEGQSRIEWAKRERARMMAREGAARRYCDAVNSPEGLTIQVACKAE